MEAAQPQDPGPESAGGLRDRPSPAGDESGGSAGRPDRSEPELVPLDPRIRVLWWVTGAAQVVAAGVLVAPLDFLLSHPFREGSLTLLAVGVFGLVYAVVPVLRFRRWRYALREQDLWIRRGVVWVTVSVIPFARLQFVDTRQGPLDRLFGLSQLIVHTAALGTSGRLPGLDVEVAERLRERLAEVEPGEASSV